MQSCIICILRLDLEIKIAVGYWFQNLNQWHFVHAHACRAAENIQDNF